VWAAEDKIYNIELVLFKLTVQKLELLIISVYFFCVLTVSHCVAVCHTHLSVSQLEIWSYNELYTKCLYADT
jgi:hypothetical protein